MEHSKVSHFRVEGTIETEACVTEAQVTEALIDWVEEEGWFYCGLVRRECTDVSKTRTQSNVPNTNLEVK
jgi:hypothetical protein